jgi:hypothetical protein
MTKTSPLGMISIAILITRWNSSKNTEQKECVRRLLRSGNELQISEAIDDLFKIVNKEFKSAELYAPEARPTEMLKILYVNGIGLVTDYGREAFDRGDLSEMMLEARREIAFYFLSMFKADHFEQLPTPEFWYGFNNTKTFHSGLRTCSP